MAFHPRTRELLALPQVGIGREELRALGVEAIHPLPENRRGYGLWGDTGNGKTWALVQVAGRLVDAFIHLSCRDPEQIKLPADPPLLLWCDWPEQAEIIKRRMFGGSAGINSWIERAKDVKFLFLDDLGRERTKDENDSCRGVLSEILGARYRAQKAVFWSSNLSPDDLAEFYKSRISSRLLSTWPPWRVEGPDLRMNPGSIPAPVPSARVLDLRERAMGGNA